MMEPWHYLLVLAACLVVTAPLELLLGARVYRRPRRLVATIAPVLAVFAAWDLAAHARGHWWFSDRYTLGPRLLDLPLEEWLFFLVIPVCAVLTYEAVGQVAARLPGRAGPAGAAPRRLSDPAATGGHGA